MVKVNCEASSGYPHKVFPSRNLSLGHPCERPLQPIPAYSSLFQLNTAYSSLLQPIPAYSSVFQHIPANSRQFQSVPASSRPFQPIPAYSSLFQHIQAYSSIFKPIPAYSSLFQPIPAYSSHHSILSFDRSRNLFGGDRTYALGKETNKNWDI